MASSRKGPRARRGPRIRFGAALLLAFSCAALPAEWDRKGAQDALAQARKMSEELAGAPSPAKEKYIRCIKTYQRVYLLDPHFSGSDDAVYEEARLYQEMGERFGTLLYYRNAAKLYRFLLKDYNDSPRCPDALLRLGDLCAGPLEDEEGAQQAYHELRTRYKSSKAAASLTMKKSRPEVAAAPVPGPAPANQQAATAGMAAVQNIRHWSTSDYTRVIIDMDVETRYAKTRLSNPDRIFFDISNAKLSHDLINKTFVVGDALLRQVRVAQNRLDVVRVVLDFATIGDYSVFELHDPFRIVVDIHATRSSAEASGTTVQRGKTAAELRQNHPAAENAPSHEKPAEPLALSATRAEMSVPPKEEKSSQVKSATSQPSGKPDKAPDLKPVGETHSATDQPPRTDKALESAPLQPNLQTESASTRQGRVPPAKTPAETALGDQPAGSVPSRQEKVQVLKTGAEKPGETKSPPQAFPPAGNKAETISHDIPVAPPLVARNADSPAGSDSAKVGGAERETVPPVASPLPSSLPKTSTPTSRGDRTLTRMLGLKIGRIVLDPGHGGHDTGTIGPGGMLEKDLVLQVARELKNLLEDRVGAEVILTRQDDSFISLEERTAVANQARADLFVSIHANSSRSRAISGVETYYLNFARTDAEREVAARENASTVRNVSDLQSLIRKIAQADKSAESRELAAIVQKKLYGGARQLFPSARNRGVRSAPFVVLIGANMPSVLAEVAFISNPRDEKVLRQENNRQRLAQALFAGIEGYMKTLGSDVAQSHTGGN